MFYLYRSLNGDTSRPLTSKPEAQRMVDIILPVHLRIREHAPTLKLLDDDELAACIRSFY